MWRLRSSRRTGGSPLSRAVTRHICRRDLLGGLIHRVLRRRGVIDSGFLIPTATSKRGSAKDRLPRSGSAAIASGYPLVPPPVGRAINTCPIHAGDPRLPAGCARPSGDSCPIPSSAAGRGPEPPSLQRRRDPYAPAQHQVGDETGRGRPGRDPPRSMPGADIEPRDPGNAADERAAVGCLWPGAGPDAPNGSVGQCWYERTPSNQERDGPSGRVRLAVEERGSHRTHASGGHEAELGGG